MRELFWILYAAGVVALFYLFISMTHAEAVSDKEAWAMSAPKETLGYLVGVNVARDADALCEDVTTLKLDNGVQLRACGTFPIVKMGAAVETPTTKYSARSTSEEFAERPVFCLGDFCRVAP